MNERCIICDSELRHSGIFICEHHTNVLNNFLEKSISEKIIKNPTFKNHCMICGEWENKIIINHPHWNFVCTICFNTANDFYKSLF